MLTHHHVDFAAHSKFGKIDSRLDREATVRQYLAFVVDLEVIHVGAVAVNLGGDGVSSAMDEVLAVSGLVDDGARGVVDFPAFEFLVAANGGDHLLRSGIAGTGDDIEDLAVL